MPQIMDKLSKIFTEITELTYEIEKEYPEIYKFLEEDPMTIPNMAHPNTDEKVMQAYLDDLKQLVRRYIETHESK